jgi:hypothetical protein
MYDGVYVVPPPLEERDSGELSESKAGWTLCHYRVREWGLSRIGETYREQAESVHQTKSTITDKSKKNNVESPVRYLLSAQS